MLVCLQNVKGKARGKNYNLIKKKKQLVILPIGHWAAEQADWLLVIWPLWEAETGREAKGQRHTGAGKDRIWGQVFPTH